MDWYVELSQPIFLPPTIQYGAEIQPIHFILPAVAVSSEVRVLVDLVPAVFR